MEVIQSFDTEVKATLDSKKSKFSRKVAKYYTEIGNIFIRKTQAEKRRDLFGKDPLVDL